MPGVLTHSPAAVVRRLLVSAGLGSEPPSPGHRPSAWPVYAFGEPGSPDSVITVYDTVGRLDGWTQPDGEGQEFHGVQVRVRSAAHDAGFAKVREIAHAFDTSVYQVTVAIGEERYLVHSLDRTGDIADLGTDSPSSKRRVYTLNALVSVIQTV